MSQYTVLRILKQLIDCENSVLPDYIHENPSQVNTLLDTLNRPSEFLRNGDL